MNNSSLRYQQPAMGRVVSGPGGGRGCGEVSAAGSGCGGDRACGGRRGPVLVQLPSNQGKDVAKLDAFLEEFKAVTHPARWKMAVEFRNADWLCPETYHVLDRRRAALCLHDMPPAAVAEPNDAAFVYIRRHGPAGDYRHSYSDRALREDAQRIRRWLEEGRMVFAYFNNDAEACAVGNARQLKEELGDSE